MQPHKTPPRLAVVSGQGARRVRAGDETSDYRPLLDGAVLVEPPESCHRGLDPKSTPRSRPPLGSGASPLPRL
ncbi:hypothetical protein GCM10009830_34130 [Glycomyces endophyticus]|uniref:AraC family transcriptional regulator n=1 Tax=Glycomyces endophyticus TaxID=480996 RepID=A0ABP4T8I1_9ACTN